MEEITQNYNEEQELEKFKRLATKIRIRDLEVSKKEWQSAFYKLAYYVKTNYLSGKLTIYDIDEKIKELKPID